MQTLELNGLQELNQEELTNIDGGYDPIAMAWQSTPANSGGTFSNNGGGNWSGGVFSHNYQHGSAAGFNTNLGTSWSVPIW